MSGLIDVVGRAGGAAFGLLWKLIALALLAASVALWWSAATARDQALTDLKVEQEKSAQLRASADDQNRAVQQWYRAAQEATARSRTAQQLAVVTGQRYDAALRQLGGAHATSCADAMPYVNTFLEQLQ